MAKLSKKTEARIEILAALRRATKQAKILNSQIDEMHLNLLSLSAKKAA